MSQFEYKIFDEVYNDIASNKKTIEFRLLNDKSKSIKKGDEIIFKVLNNEDKYLLVKVIDKHIYKDLDELWNSKDALNNTLNYTKEDFINTFYSIFGKKNVNSSKIVGIEFYLIKK